ncbi:MAG: hypothetical protein A2900_01760 [Candidatus Chisholmbacteria bacterium RIFCSPLOWO2_01_FULL_50_28]|uniref:Glycerophosphoryl diester phosphodiesterase membrane domain-containing protein n=1 Tax=Candidatus Chisholmbacteria bacterium RIFCSPHIGHO2_01_FULL_52_32 TaxID=1797591 RepID=A0A1G1VTY6_9BACT|nr:MAG: hypothetical protein A2786_04985 [Candidatus Chisholmbacteria bacterium RIFCSPHIGHO2_01_FULL_52_32]OGY19810.1 MAG: hypothetical protein A2900_01760 [Candidatus Chisholmbacteria bacterium RIFCSPLOWO2_01_FULL_50_28]
MEYKRILRRSWEIAKTSKVLWVFGMVVAALSGGSANFGGNSWSEGEKFTLPKTSPPQDVPHQTSQVLGQATTAISQMIGSIPIWVWLILGGTILLAVLIAIGVALYIRNWGKGALIASIHNLEDQTPPSLKSGSKSGVSVVKRFIILHVGPWLIWVALAVVLTIFAIGSVIITANLGSEALKITIIAISILVWVFGLVATGLLLNLSIILGEQLIIRENLSANQALKKGFRLTKKYFASLLGMGIINMGIGCGFGCLTVLLIMLFVVSVIVAFAISKTAGLIVSAIIAVPILTLVLFSLLLRGIYTVFNTATWTLVEREIETREKNGTEDGN